MTEEGPRPLSIPGQAEKEVTLAGQTKKMAKCPVWSGNREVNDQAQ